MNTRTGFRWTLHRRSKDASGAFDLALMLFLGAMLFVRVIGDDWSAAGSRQSGTLNLSGAIAVLFVAVAGGLLLSRRRGAQAAALATLCLCVWTAIAVHTRGASTVSLREGVREGSVIALAVIAYNAWGSITAPRLMRLVQFIGITPAVIALYQLATHTGMDVAGHVRSNGTLAQPNSAAMFFALATIASLWRYLDCGRSRFDTCLTALFAAALIATFSIDGLATAITMLLVFGALHVGSLRVKLAPCLISGIMVLVFFATPLGSQRIAKETSTNAAGVERGEPNTSLAWRLHRWKLLLPQWERNPVFGQGLGTTTTERAIPGDRFAGALPHNEYLRYLVETGVIGLLALFFALYVLARSLIHRWRIQSKLAMSAPNTATLAIAATVGCLVNALADNTLLNSPSCYAAALILVAALRLPPSSTQPAPIPLNV